MAFSPPSFLCSNFRNEQSFALAPLFTFRTIRYAAPYALGCHCEKGGNPILQGGVHTLPRDYRLVPHLIFSRQHMSHSNIFVLSFYMEKVAKYLFSELLLRVHPTELWNLGSNTMYGKSK